MSKFNQMSNISLREWTKDPLNRIKLMEDVITELQLRISFSTWLFICPIIRELIFYNAAYSHIARCRILASTNQSPGGYEYAYLFDILPELVPYKDRDRNNERVWFQNYNSRVKALQSAIQLIKLNKQY